MRDVIEIAGLTKLYKTGGQEIAALAGVDLRVAEGEFLAIMGTSGSGKSTLMNVIGLLDRPTAGSYRLDGHRVDALADAQLARIRNRTLGFVFQSFHLLPRTSAVDNVALPLAYAGVARAERRRLALSALERVGLGARADHQPHQLSGGQQQRVAIARAIVNRPRVLLADEPTGALDTATTAEILGLLEQLHAGGMTLVLVTHEPDVAEHAQRIIRFRDGRIVGDTARPREVAGLEVAR